MKFGLVLILALAGAAAHAADTELVLIDPGTVTEAEGLAAWERIYAVASHPRCANCHTGDDNLPMWSGPSFGAARPHGMNIVAGGSRIGAETLPCQTCHITSTRANTIPHAAPHTGMLWQLAPVAFEWFDRDSAAICAQMRDPARNGGRDGAALVEHILHDAELTGFITWAFAPGGMRDPAPGGLQAHLDDTVVWTAAGMPLSVNGS